MLLGGFTYGGRMAETEPDKPRTGTRAIVVMLVSGLYLVPFNAAQAIAADSWWWRVAAGGGVVFGLWLIIFAMAERRKLRAGLDRVASGVIAGKHERQ